MQLDNRRMCGSLVTMTLLLAFTVSARAGRYQDAYSLQTELFTNYSTRIRPLTNQTRKIDVSFGFELLTIVEVDELRGMLVLNGFLIVEWTDEILNWNPDDYNGIETMSPYPEDIWRPRVEVLNTQDERDAFKDDHTYTTVDNNGSVVWAPGSLFYVGCLLKLQAFPFDQHSCAIVFTVIYFNSSYMNINTLSAKPTLDDYVSNGEWELVGNEHGVFRTNNAGPGVPTYMVSLTIRRRPAFFLFNVMIPVFMLSCLTLLAFAVPEDSGEKVSYSIAVLLAYSVYMTIMSSHLPATSDSMPYVSYLIFILFVLAGLITIDVILIVWLHNKEEDEAKRIERSGILSRALVKIKAFRVVRAAIKAAEKRFSSTSKNVQDKERNPVPVPPNSHKDGALSVDLKPVSTTPGRKEIGPVPVSGRSCFGQDSSENSWEGCEQDDMEPQNDRYPKETQTCAENIVTGYSRDKKSNNSETNENKQQRDSKDDKMMTDTHNKKINKYKNLSSTLNTYSGIVFGLLTLMACLICSVLIITNDNDGSNLQTRRGS